MKCHVILREMKPDTTPGASAYRHSRWGLREIYLKTKKLTKNFHRITEDEILEFPQMLLIIRLSMNMSINNFSEKFGMHQQWRYEKGLVFPTRRTLNRFFKLYREYDGIRDFSWKTIKLRYRTFMKKHEGGLIVGKKTLLKKNDPRTVRIAKSGARKGGLATVKKYGKQHMVKLSKKIQRGREKHSGFRSFSEEMTAEILQKLGEKFRYEVIVNGFLPDFVLEDGTIIEVMCLDREKYWEKQREKLKSLVKDNEVIVVTNRPEKFSENSFQIVKFSKRRYILKKRLYKAIQTVRNST